jgi:hypothetical protein
MIKKNIPYLIAGMWFGVLLVKAEVISWYRIQEMFRFQSFHMYGIIGSAVVTAGVSYFLMQRFGLKSRQGEPVALPTRTFQWGQVWGSALFGIGWALTGACPGPLFAQLGSGWVISGLALASAIAGTWVFGLLRGKLVR